jgi:predicted ATP-grasp superfamily ATP-dependent carboligase
VAETILVLGTAQRAAQATARSLARGGFRVIGAWQGGRLIGRTRYCERLVKIPASSEVAAFVETVRELCERERVQAIIPLSDELLATVLTRPEATGSAVVIGPSLDGFVRLADKVGLFETASAAGVLQPSTVVVRDTTELRELPRLPAYVKVTKSVYTGRPAGRPTRVTERDECEQLVRYWTDRGDTVLVQEEILGERWRFHFVRGQDRLYERAARQLGDHPYRTGQSTVLQFCAAPPGLASASRRLLDEVGYRGIGSIQWIERQGDWYVHDVNLRIPAAVAGTIAAGLDMPRLGVEIALGRELPCVDGLSRRVQYVWFPGEVMALVDTVNGAPSGRSPLEIGASLFLGALSPRRRLVPFDVTDPLPTVASIAALVRHRPTTSRL